MCALDFIIYFIFLIKFVLSFYFIYEKSFKYNFIVWLIAIEMFVCDHGLRVYSFLPLVDQECLAYSIIVSFEYLVEIVDQILESAPTFN